MRDIFEVPSGKVYVVTEVAKDRGKKTKELDIDSYETETGFI